MATDVSAGRSTNELLVAATRGESAAVEALYTHYLQFGTDVAMEHGSDDPVAAYDQAFLETMAHSLELSQREPGSFASHLERAIEQQHRPVERADADASASSSVESSTDEEAVDEEAVDEEAIDAESIDAEAVDEKAVDGTTATELGILPLAAAPTPPRTPNQLLDRFHVRSLVTIAAALLLVALIVWVFLHYTSPTEPDPVVDAATTSEQARSTPA